jgi:hypothetical protein
MAERNYPGTLIEVLDGNLANNITIPEDIALVIDRASTGPVGRLYYVSSAKEASVVYGSDSPLIKSMQRAFLAGAQNVALYRVGGRVASIENLFGLGTALSTVEASSIADVGYSVYIGPEPLNPAVDALIVYKNNKIVFSNALNGEVDQALVDVDGFDKVNNEIYVGSFTDPVPFYDVVAEAGKRVVQTVTGTNTVTIDPADFAKISAYGLQVKLNGKVLKKADYSVDVSGVVTLVPVVAVADTVEVAYVVKFTPSELEDAELAYKAGQDLINSTWKEYYEGFDSALDSIQRVTARSVFIGDLFNVPNIADGSTETNRLEYLSIEEDEAGDKVYEWSANKFLYRNGATTTTDVNEADLTANGQPIVVKQYHEVDFAHRAGMWGYESTSEGNYPNIMVGATGPKAYNNKYINLWIGKAPTVNLEGKITVNGTGLLGHRLMVGTTDRAGGYFATDTGFPDGTPVTDSNNFTVDLGKYLSIIVSQVVSSNATGEIVSGAASYAGLATIIAPGDSTTNQVIGGTILATDLKRIKLKELQAAGYVVFENRTKGVTVVSGNLASRLNSDYRYLSTSIVMNYIASDIAEVCDPFIGKGIDGTSKVALHTALHTRFAQRQRQGFFINYLMQLRQVEANIIDVAYTITAKDELRQVVNTIKLAREISDEVLS